jgi:hypothetical protein
MPSRPWLARTETWRPDGRRPLCLLIADRPVPAALREVSGAGAWIETSVQLDSGARVQLRHPQAGTIAAHVIGHDKEGLRLAFDRSEAAVAFALAAIASDMSRAG